MSEQGSTCRRTTGLFAPGLEKDIAISRLKSGVPVPPISFLYPFPAPLVHAKPTSFP